MIAPVVLFFIVFAYIPMYGIFMAFYDYIPALGFAGSEFVGLDNFKLFLDSAFLGRVVYNTFMLNVYDILFGFPMPILFALLMFEIASKKLTKTVQFVLYLPYFISLVVVCGLIKEFLDVNGLINNLFALFGAERQNYLNNSKYYFAIYILSNVWQTMGFSSIIYFGALCGINTELFEAAKIDGANRMVILLRITLPSILPTIIIMFILRMGGVFNVGFEKSYLLMTTSNKVRSEVVSTYIYERGLGRGGNWGYGTAVGLLNALVNFGVLFITNKLASKTGYSLW